MKQMIYRKLSELKKLPNNPRKINNQQFEKLCDSIRGNPEYFEARPIILSDRTGELIIIAGNQRYEAALKIGIDKVPTFLISGLTEEKEREIIIRDNIANGEWDVEILGNEWDKEQLEEWGLELPDWDGKQIEAKDDDFNISDKIQTDIIPGDLFKIGNHRLLCGDATNSDDVLRLMDGENADMVFTDPPYDLENVSWSERIFDYVNDDRHVFIMDSDRLLISIINILFDRFRKIFAVDFRQARLVSNNMPMTRVDLVAEFCNGKTRFNNTNDGFSTLIECAKIHNSDVDKNFGHDQAKNPILPGKFIEHYTNDGELVIDIFGGSGSTMAASEQLNRKCYMIELEPKNCQIIIDRMLKCYNIEANKL